MRGTALSIGSGLWRRDTAQQLLFRHTREQNEALGGLLDKEPDDQLTKIRTMIGQTMGSMYLDAILPILTEHPDLTPKELKDPG